MIRQLPTINLASTKFYVDLRLEEFRQADCPFNSISFDNLVDENGSYLLFYDTVSKNVFQGNSLPLNDEKNLRVLTIPSLSELDPVGFENMFGDFLNF